MNWNDAIHHFFGKKNQVEIAGDKLQCFVDAVKKIDERAEYNSMGQRKPKPGFRYFNCLECNRNFWDKTRDCHSPSNGTCPECFADVRPDRFEEHSEWAVDKSGNLV